MSYIHTANDYCEYYQVRIAKWRSNTSLFLFYESWYPQGVKVIPTLVIDYRLAT